MLESIKLHLMIICKIGISVFTIYLPDSHEERYCVISGATETYKGFTGSLQNALNQAE